MAAAGCASETDSARQSARAFPSSLHRRRLPGFAGRQQYGRLAPAHDCPGLLPQLQTLDRRITQVRAKILPKPPEQPRQNRLRMSDAALEALSDSAERLQHHPELAEALQQLVRHQQK